MELKALVNHVASGLFTAPRRVWLVYTEDTAAFPAALKALAGQELSVVAPRWVNVDQAGVRVLAESDAESRLADVDVLVLPSVPRSLAGQLKAREPESALARLLRAAGRRGLPIVGIGEESVLKPLGIRAISAGSLVENVLSPKAGDKDCFRCTTQGQCAVQCPGRVQEVLAQGATRLGGVAGMKPSQALARMIDHTLLKPDASEQDVRKLCEEARTHRFASVCVNPHYVPLAARLLKGSDVMVCTVIGFPLGATPPDVKAFETRKAIADGADEIDMVINVGALKSKQYPLVEEDIRAVVGAASGKTVKVILETALLTDEEKVIGSALSKSAGAHFVKTSTGFSSGGATEQDIALMRKTVGPELGVKASGGVRDTQTAVAMVRAGATRIGASASVAIVGGGAASGQGY